MADGHLFVLDGGKRVLSRLDPKTGAKVWSGKLETPDTIWASPTGADGKIYIFDVKGRLNIIKLVDGGNQKRSFTYVSDGIDALMRILENPHGVASGKIFNIGNPRNNFSVRELAEMMLALAAQYPEYAARARKVASSKAIRFTSRPRRRGSLGTVTAAAAGMCLI